VAKEVRRPGRAASQVGTVTIPAQTGLDVDVEATLQTVQKVLASATSDQIINVPLAVIELSPPEATTSVATSAESASAPAPLPLLLRDEKFNLQFALDAATLSKLWVSTKPPQLDEDALRGILNGWAAQVVVPARDARLDFNPETGAVTVIQPSQSGRKLDIDATVAAIHQAVSAGQNQAALVLVDDVPEVDMNNVANMGIRELVSSGVSYFRGSAPERVHNIEVGASKLDGVVIAPDKIFSFNKYVEDITAANGFADSLIIWGDQTATGAGGGICQVSTTVFRAAYTGGLPIVERYNHGYVVGWYGDPGLDATIFTPSVDFRFRNDTGAYLLVKPVVDSANGVITINLYGTKPNRQVTLKPAVQSDLQEPEPPQYKVDDTLAKGQIKQVESAHKGLSVSVERVIVENGTTRTDTILSKYQPWRAVYLVGPGTEIPNVAATAIPTPTVVLTSTTSVTATGGVTPTADHSSAP
jgi:vancomycin resistance protein YoaR